MIFRLIVDEVARLRGQLRDAAAVVSSFSLRAIMEQKD